MKFVTVLPDMVLMESRWLPHQSHGQCEEDEDEEENVLLEDRDKEERMRIMGQVVSGRIMFKKAFF